MIKLILAVALHMAPAQETPEVLYKVLSMADWDASQGQSQLRLPEMDAAFIHFSKEDQLEGVVVKYWSNVPEYIVLRIDPSKLPGKLVYEANPGGTSQYYHLYDGSIPVDAIVDSKVFKK